MCIPHPDAVAPVAVHGGADVPTVEGVWCPTCPFVGFLVNQDTNARRGNWCAVEVVVAVDLGPGGQLGVDLGTSHEVERQRCLVDEAIPQVKREVAVCAAQSCDEMIFEGLDGAFGGIGTMDAGENLLEIDPLVDHIFSECFRALVVKALELRPQAGFDKHVVDMFVCGKDGAGCFVWHWLGVDGVAIEVVQDEELCVACA